MPIPGFEDQINCDLVIEPYISGDAAGARVYGSPTTYKAIQQGPGNRVFVVDGEALWERAKLFVGAELRELDPRSRITIQGGPIAPGPNPPRILTADSAMLDGQLYYWLIHVQ